MSEQDPVALISALNQQRAAAMVRVELDVLRAMFDDDLLYVHSSGGYDTKETLIGKLKDGMIQYRSAEITVERVFTHDGSTVIAVERILADVSVNERAVRVDSAATSVWVRRARGLRLLALHSVSRDSVMSH